MRQSRSVIRIDEDLCNGCGQCVTACAEGAIQVIEGKARLVSETYCDGLGACLGHCPQGAITVEERPAEAFDAEAVKTHLAVQAIASAAPKAEPKVASHFQGCPGSLARMLQGGESKTDGRSPREAGTGKQPSQLRNWPVQLKLAPLSAPYYQGADILLSADCAPFSYADFHGRFLAGKLALVGCPKLDEVQLYESKLSQILAGNAVRSLEVVYMEVPCCTGLAFMARRAIQATGRDIPLRLTRIGIRGEILETVDQPRVAV
ncbi:4Fe-4S binding protein [bacterium]|nr:4Fe-4S binding protein [bacterium]